MRTQLFLLISIPFMEVWMLDIKPTQVRVTTGAFLREIHEVGLYTATIPLIYAINVTFSKTPESILNLKRCNTDSVACTFPIAIDNYVKHVTAILESITEDVLMESLGVNKGRSRRGLTDIMGSDWNPLSYIGDFWSFCCGAASKRDLQSLQVNSDEVHKFVETLKKSVITNNQNVFNIKANYELFQTNISQVFNRVHDHIDQILQEQHNISESETLHGQRLNEMAKDIDFFRRGLLQTYSHMNSITEIIRFKDLQDHCRAQTISLLAVTPKELAKDLKPLLFKIKKDGYELVIPIEEITRYTDIYTLTD